MSERVEQIGSFMVETGEILVTDPCYDDAPYCHIVLPAHNGKWWAGIRRRGNRIAELYAAFERKTDEERTFVPKDVGIAGVDSGQMGIYDYGYAFGKNIEEPLHRFESGSHSDWYLMCCHRTLREENAGVIPYGAVSQSGWGDGAYQVKASYHEGKIEYVEIIFIEEDWWDQFGNDYDERDEESSYKIEEDKIEW